MKGLNLLAWLMPPISILFGAMLVMLTISQWRGARILSASPRKRYVCR